MFKSSSLIFLFLFLAFSSFSFTIEGTANKDIFTFYQIQKRAKSLKKDDEYVVREMMNYYSSTSLNDTRAQSKRLINNTLFFEQSNYQFILHSNVIIHLLLSSNDRLLLLPVIAKLETKLKQVKDLDELQTIEFQVSTYYQFIGEFDKSLKHAQHALQLSRNLNDTLEVQLANYNIGVLYYFKHNYKQARNFLEKALYFEKFGLKEKHFNQMQLLSAIEFDEGNIDKAYVILKHLERYVTDVNKGMYYANLGEVQIALSLWSEAIISLKKAELILEKENSVGLYNVYTNLALSYSKIRDFENSYKYELLKNEIVKKAQKQEALMSIEKRKQVDLKRIQSLEKSKSIRKTTDSQKKTSLLIMTLSFVFVLLLGSIYSLIRTHRKNRQLVNMSLQKMQESKEYKITIVGEYTESELIEKKISPLLVEKFEKAFYDKELFKDPDLTIQKLAKKIGTNVKDLSQTINGHYNVPFRNLVNEKRVELAKELLIDKRYENYSMEGIAETVGYKNKSMFYLHFKNLTGVTPASFQSHAIKLLKNNSTTQLENASS